MDEYECIDELGQTIALGKSLEELRRSLEWYLDETERPIDGIDCFTPEGDTIDPEEIVGPAYLVQPLEW